MSQTSPAGFEFRFAGLDDGRIAAVEWDFGDGTSCSGRTASHLYAATGAYCVTVSATDDGGKVGSAQVIIHASREIPVTTRESIQRAIDAAETGDTLMLAGGEYFERIDFHGKAITVRSASLAQRAVLMQRPITWDDSTGTIVRFTSGEGRNSVLYGVILRGDGSACQFSGGAILLHASSPTIDDCIIEQFAAVQGGGIAAFESRALITGCTIASCSARLNGGGVYAQGLMAFPEFIGNTLQGNVAELGGGIYFRAEKDCTIGTSAAVPVLRGNTFALNTATGSPQTADDQVGGAVHVGCGVRVVESGNRWTGNSPYDIRYDEAVQSREAADTAGPLRVEADLRTPQPAIAPLTSTPGGTALELRSRPLASGHAGRNAVVRTIGPQSETARVLSDTPDADLCPQRKPPRTQWQIRLTLGLG